MRFSIIAAISANRVIGYRKRLPWHLPADLKRFKDLTMGKPMLMGRRTYESIGRALPGRTSLVLTRDAGFRADGCIVVNSVAAAEDVAGDAAELMVIGGAALYEMTLPRARRMYLTRIHAEFEGDAFFPEYDGTEWLEASREEHDADERNAHAYTFVTLCRCAQTL